MNVSVIVYSIADKYAVIEIVKVYSMDKRHIKPTPISIPFLLVSKKKKNLNDNLKKVESEFKGLLFFLHHH